MCVPVGRPGTMSNELSGKTIAFLATDGVEQVELTEPWRAIEEAGGTPHLVSIRNEPIQGFDHQDKAETFEVDDLVTDTSPDDFDALVLPGGAINPDNLRMDGDAVEFGQKLFLVRPA